ncbi:MAG: hypothetical protein ACREMT_10255 [Vulcanimicrobiaceae bacterium]
MIDEWIVDKASVDRAAAIPGVAFVKFKLMKAGGFASLCDLIGHARDLGLKIVLGNGVASDVGCLGEAVVARRLGLDLAGEMNGFLKTRQRLTAALAVQNGNMKVKTLGVSPDQGVLSETRVQAVQA